jgi:hypothetical protein
MQQLDARGEMKAWDIDPANADRFDATEQARSSTHSSSHASTVASQ